MREIERYTSDYDGSDRWAVKVDGSYDAEHDFATEAAALVCIRMMSEGDDHWLPANGGQETPFLDRAGRRLMWCFNPAQQRHAYIDLDRDMEIEEGVI